MSKFLYDIADYEGAMTIPDLFFETVELKIQPAYRN